MKVGAAFVAQPAQALWQEPQPLWQRTTDGARPGIIERMRPMRNRPWGPFFIPCMAPSKRTITDSYIWRQKEAVRDAPFIASALLFYYIRLWHRSAGRRLAVSLALAPSASAFPTPVPCRPSPPPCCLSLYLLIHDFPFTALCLATPSQLVPQAPFVSLLSMLYPMIGTCRAQTSD